MNEISIEESDGIRIWKEHVLGDGYVYEHIRKGMPKEQTNALQCSKKMREQMKMMNFHNMGNSLLFSQN